MTTITKTNNKGQLIIPKKYLQVLGIDNQIAIKLIIKDRILSIQPIYLQEDSRVGYLTVLEKTKGAWSEDEKLLPKKNNLELIASKNRKLAW